MSYDWTDAAYDEAMDSLYKDFSASALEDGEIYDRMVEDFKETRLRDFYLHHPKVTKIAKGALTEARSLLKTSSRCSLVLAVTASEVCFRDALLTPILHGSFNSQTSADLIVNLIVTTKKDGYTKALLQILDRHTGVDLRNLLRPGSLKPLWEEMREMQKIRNLILHQAQSTSFKDAERATKIAECLISDVFEQVIRRLELHLHDDKVCGSRECVSDIK